MDEPLKPFRALFDADLKRAKWTQSDIAEKMRVKQQAVSSWRSRNMVPFRRQIDLVNLFKDVLGDESEIVRAHTRMDLNQTMGEEALESLNRVRTAAWDRRQEYTTVTTKAKAQRKLHTSKVITSAAAKDAEAAINPLTTSSLSPTALPNIFDFAATHETIKAHSVFLETLDVNFPSLETRYTLDHLGTQHQFDICIEDKIFIASSGCFDTKLGKVRDFPRYAIFCIKLAAWANTLRDFSFIVVHGAANHTPSERKALENAQKNLEVLNLNMVIVDSYHDYYDLIGNIYSNTKV